MGGPSSFDDPFARRGSPASQGFGAGRDRFKEKAGKGGKKDKAGFDQPRPARSNGDAFAGRKTAASGAGYYNPFEPRPAPTRAKGFTPPEPAAKPLPPVPPPKRLGPKLKVVASQPEPEPVIAFAAAETRREQAKREEVKRRKGKSSSLVLITGSAAETAAAETSVDTAVPTGGGTDELVLPPPRSPEAKTRSRSAGGGGSGAGSNGGDGQPPHRERMFNQDDVVGAALGIAMLFLLMIFFLRGKDEAPDNRLVGPQYASNGQLVAPPPPPAPKVDPFGDAPVDLKPTGPIPEPAPPVETAVVQAAPPPPPAALTIESPIRAWFCTAKSEITPDTRKAMEADLTRLAKAYEGKELVVRGYADTRGTTLFNHALGGERARVVADFLRTKGITVAEYVGVGELDGLDDNQNCSNQRRVDVWVAGGPAAEPSRTCAPPPEVEDLACA